MAAHAVRILVRDRRHLDFGPLPLAQEGASMRTARAVTRPSALPPSGHTRLRLLLRNAHDGSPPPSRSNPPHSYNSSGPTASPPAPPAPKGITDALDPHASEQELSKIAREQPELRRWILANPSIPEGLVTFIERVGGPDVPQALAIWRRGREEGLSAGPVPGSGAGGPPRTPACVWQASRPAADCPPPPSRWRP